MNSLMLYWRTILVHIRNSPACLPNWSLYTPKNGFQSNLNNKAAQLFPRPYSSLLSTYRFKQPKQTPTKTRLMCTVNCTTMCVGTSTICLCSIHSSLPSLYPLSLTWLIISGPLPLFPRRTLGGAWEQGACCSTIEMNYCELTIRTPGCEDFSKYPCRFVTFDLISIVSHPVIRYSYTDFLFWVSRSFSHWYSKAKNKA